MKKMIKIILTIPILWVASNVYATDFQQTKNMVDLGNLHNSSSLGMGEQVTATHASAPEERVSEMAQINPPSQEEVLETQQLDQPTIQNVKNLILAFEALSINGDQDYEIIKSRNVEENLLMERAQREFLSQLTGQKGDEKSTVTNENNMNEPKINLNTEGAVTVPDLQKKEAPKPSSEEQTIKTDIEEKTPDNLKEGEYLKKIDQTLNKMVDDKMAQHKAYEAILLLTEALKKEPENTAILYKEALVYMDLAQFNKAQQILNHIYRIESETKETVKLQKIITDKIREEARNEIEGSSKKSNEVGYLSGIDPILNQIVEEKMTQHKSKEAIFLLEQALKKEPENTALLYREALIYIDIEQYQKAQQTLDKLYRVELEAKEVVRLQKMLDEKVKGKVSAEGTKKAPKVEEEKTKKESKDGVNNKGNPSVGLTEDVYISKIDPVLNEVVEDKIKNHKSHEAIVLLETELESCPSNTGLIYKEAYVYVEAEQYKKAQKTLNQLYKLDPCIETESKNVQKLQETVDEKRRDEPRNEFFYYTDRAYVSDISAYWTYSTISYYRISDYAKYGISCNNARRYGLTGNQYQFDGYAELTKRVSAIFSFAFASNRQSLYPTIAYFVEGYYHTVNDYEFSLGQGQQRFTNFSNEKIYRYTSSFGKYFDKYFVSVRWNRYTLPSCTFYEVGIQRYFDDESFIGVRVNGGTIPDISDLPPLDRIITLRQKGVNFIGRIAINKKLFVILGAGFAAQVYKETQRHRRMPDGSLALVWRF